MEMADSVKNAVGLIDEMWIPNVFKKQNDLVLETPQNKPYCDIVIYGTDKYSCNGSKRFV